MSTSGLCCGQWSVSVHQWVCCGQWSVSVHQWVCCGQWSVSVHQWVVLWSVECKCPPVGCVVVSGV